jgi:hypothetical protein
MQGPIRAHLRWHKGVLPLPCWENTAGTELLLVSATLHFDVRTAVRF